MANGWAEPKWWWLVVFAIAAIPVILSRCDRGEDVARAEKNRRQDQWIDNQKEQRSLDREKPRLLFIGIDGPRTDGFTHIKYQNQSTAQNAIVSFMQLEISDPQQLQFIERYHPRPPENQAGAPFDKDEVRLVHGVWQGGNYLFYVYPDLYVAPNKPHDFLTCIVDPRLPPTTFRGTFTIELQNGESDVRENVAMRSRQR